MNALLSVLFGTGLVILVYGLSFLPSARLGEIDEPEEILSVDQEKPGLNSDAAGEGSTGADRSGTAST